VLGVAADREQTAVHPRMQRLDAAIHHFGIAGKLTHIEHLQPGIAEYFPGTASRNQLNPDLGERAREFHDAEFVGNGNKRAGSAAQIFGHRSPIFAPRVSRQQFHDGSHHKGSH
jgi:hypothetical protein